MSSNNGEPASKQGIDIRQALDILSARKSEAHSHTENGGCHHHDAPEESKSMGQTIDLNKPAEPETPPETVDPDMEAQRQQLEEERAKRRIEIEEQLQSMTVKELIQAVTEAQQKRVTTYKDYDKGLDLVLKTGNMTNYPNVCAEATASFSVLSDTINSIHKVIAETRNRNDLKGLLDTLQKHEKEKLSLTAALHLDKIRESQEIGGDERILTLLQQEVGSLQTKITACVEEINETIEELRYAMAEEE